MPAPARALVQALRRARRWGNQMLGRDVCVPIQLHCRREFLGSEYGGWCVCPDLITTQSLVYSFGVGQDISWDLAMIERFGVQIHAFDPTPKSVQWIKSQNLPRSFHFHEYGIAAYDGVAQFALPRPDFVSYSIIGSPGGASQNTAVSDLVEAPVRRLTTLMEMLGHCGRRIDVLKMDIEGAEIEVIQHFPSLGIEVDQLLVEFHHTVGESRQVAQTRDAIQTIRRCGFKLFFQSAVGKEFSFARAHA